MPAARRPAPAPASPGGPPARQRRRRPPERAGRLAPIEGRGAGPRRQQRADQSSQDAPRQRVLAGKRQGRQYDECCETRATGGRRALRRPAGCGAWTDESCPTCVRDVSPSASNSESLPGRRCPTLPPVHLADDVAARKARADRRRAPDAEQPINTEQMDAEITGLGANVETGVGIAVAQKRPLGEVRERDSRACSCLPAG